MTFSRVTCDRHITKSSKQFPVPVLFDAQQLQLCPSPAFTSSLKHPPLLASIPLLSFPSLHVFLSPLWLLLFSLFASSPPLATKCWSMLERSFRPFFFSPSTLCQATSFISVTWITSANDSPLLWALDPYLIDHETSSHGYKDLTFNMCKSAFIIFFFHMWFSPVSSLSKWHYYSCSCWRFKWKLSLTLPPSSLH